MQAGKLRHRVRLESRVRAENAIGEVEETFELVAERWAHVRPITAAELLRANKPELQTTHVVTLRYVGNIPATSRLVWGTRTFQIEGVINRDERNRQMDLTCVETTNS
jgi:SPP1 family predicted phage head-tail adaptor